MGHPPLSISLHPDAVGTYAPRASHPRAAWLAHEIELWRARHPADAGHGAVDGLRAALTHFSRAMHVAGVRGPEVRRQVAEIMRRALQERVDDGERDRLTRAAQGLVDVIYLTGAHRPA